MLLGVARTLTGEGSEQFFKFVYISYFFSYELKTFIFTFNRLRCGVFIGERGEPVRFIFYAGVDVSSCANS